MKQNLTTLGLLILLVFSCVGQSYNDVLVVVNSNSTISQNVGNYFKAQRSIPNVNICTIAMPTTEEIDSLTSATIFNQIKTYITTNGLTNSINYIVTTQGVPLKIRRSSGVFSSTSNASSFDSDLALVQSNIENKIGGNGPELNPYWQSSTAFSRVNGFSKIRLVTRLGGYSYSDITGLIDRAAQPYHSDGKFVFDQDPSKTTMALYNVRMQVARDTLANRGYNTLLNTNSAFVIEQTNVLGYVSWGSNDSFWSSYTQKAQPHFTWSAKALAETYVSSSGRSFADSMFIEPTIGWQSLVADLIHENGVTGVKGYVWEPFASSLADVSILFNRWTKGFNLAESYYASSAFISWMDVVIGDPKSTFAGNGHLPVQLTAFNGLFHNNTVTLTWTTATEVNSLGFEVQKQVGVDWKNLGFVYGSGNSSTTRSYRFVDENPGSSNTYRLKQVDRDGTFTYSNVLQVKGENIFTFQLNQNYPNPFNPSTAISYFLPEKCGVTLHIFSLSGASVRTLKDANNEDAGVHTVQWDGKDEHGSPVTSGFYLYRIVASNADQVLFTSSKVMSLVK